MNRDSNASIIPKIILILGTLSILGIILLFFRPRGDEVNRSFVPSSQEELFSQVITSAVPEILKLWEEGDYLLNGTHLNCPNEIIENISIGKSYYQCQPHLWQCYWEGGVGKESHLKVDLHGQSYTVQAKASFDPIKSISDKRRYYRPFKNDSFEFGIRYGYIIELAVKELPGFTQPMILSDTCRDTYLPQRIYAYGQAKDKRDEGFVWDNFGRDIYIDKYYVSNQRVNEWLILIGQEEKIVSDRSLWPLPALLSFKEQVQYCKFYGKRPLEAKLFDSATMTPGDLKNTMPDRVLRPETPWQRDLSKTFLGTARVNADYELTPLDCQLAQVQGCSKKLFTTDSATWMGINYGLGFYPEALVNTIEVDNNLKLSSFLLPPNSEWHVLGLRSTWKGQQSRELPVAFRCYEELVP